MPSTADYQALVPHANRKPKFLATVAAWVQPFVDMQVVAGNLTADFDLDTAVGAQLDAVGLWVGITRNLETPLVGVFFAWNTPGVGWNQGAWRGKYQDGDTLTVLGDSDYRLLLRAKIAANHWDGTIPGAYAVLKIAFAGTGLSILVKDNQDMSLSYIVLGPPLSAVQLGLLLNGQLTLKPAGVRIRGYYYAPAGPLFGWNTETAVVAGWNQGVWLQKLGGGN